MEKNICVWMAGNKMREGREKSNMSNGSCIKRER